MTDVFAAYYGTCATTAGTGAYVDWTFVKRDLSNPGMTGVLANMRVRPLNPCVESAGVGDGTGAAVTLQSNTTNTQRIVQVGFLRFGVTGGCGGDANSGTKIPKDGAVHFWYTKFDDASGRTFLADGWYEAPEIDDEYRFKVESSTDANGNPILLHRQYGPERRSLLPELLRVRPEVAL